MPLDIWHSEVDLAILRTFPASALAGAFMRRWSRYISDYRDSLLRAGASASPSLLRNDDNARWLRPTFNQMHRVLKWGGFAVSFYGWMSYRPVCRCLEGGRVPHGLTYRFSQVLFVIFPVPPV
nr:hypothetical protein [Acetobacter syzygii]